MNRFAFLFALLALWVVLAFAGCAHPDDQRARLGAAASYATETTPGTRAARDAADPEPVPSPTAPIR